MQRRKGFTLIETLIVMAIMLILSAVAYPKYVDLKMDAEGTTMSATVRNIREKIRLHTSVADVPMSSDGFPDEITADWFPGEQLPRDLWTYGEFKIQVVNGPKDAIAPNSKTFTIKPDGTAAGHTAWYNRSNGAFCVKVPDEGSQSRIEETFWAINDGRYAAKYGSGNYKNKHKKDKKNNGNGNGNNGNGNGNGNGHNNHGNGNGNGHDHHGHD